MKVVVLPIKTISEANAREHWGRKAKRVAGHRSAAALALRVPSKAYRAATEGRTVVVTITRIAPSPGLDDDNLRSSLKAVRDGVAEALGIDDRDPRYAWAYAQRRGETYAVEVALSWATVAA